jgi:Kdo2-lipid IVA lauroyltransferase/acyltransferase
LALATHLDPSFWRARSPIAFASGAIEWESKAARGRIDMSSVKSVRFRRTFTKGQYASGRVPVEFAFIDRLWDYDLDQATSKRIVIDPATAERIRKLRDRNGPALCFGAHLANWEMPALAAAALGMKSAMVYRRPNSQKPADELLRVRQGVMGRLIPDDAKGARKIFRALQDGCVVGMLVDQHDGRGVEVKSFGRSCFVSSTIARLARRFDCPIHGARSIRLPDRRFAFELTDALDAPRGADGKIDIAATMQMITSTIEGWVREHPQQWVWLHRRWR